MGISIKRSARAQPGGSLPEETHEEILRRRDLTKEFMSAVREAAPEESWAVECEACGLWWILAWRAPGCACERSWDHARFQRIPMRRDRALKLAALYRAVQREGLNAVAHRLCMRRDRARDLIDIAVRTGLADLVDRDPNRLDGLSGT